jgi:hypothetical protein
MTTTTARADTLIPEAHPFKQHLHRVTAADTAQPTEGSVKLTADLGC